MARVGRRHRRGPTRFWIILGLATFVVVDVALVIAALGVGTTSGSNAGRVTPSSATAAPSPSATQTPTPAAAPEPEPALPVTRLLVAADASIAWRAPITGCGPDPLVLQTTIDGGETWTDQPLGRYDVRRVLSLSVGPGGGYGQGVFGVGEDCVPTPMRSFTKGTFWEVEQTLRADFSYLDPFDPATVVIAGESVDAPCPDAVQLVTAAEAPTVLCADGSVFALDQDAEPAVWSAVGSAPGALALVAGADRVLAAAAGLDQCPDLGLVPVPAAGDPECADVTGVPGATVLVQAGQWRWLWAGDSVSVRP